MKPIEKEIIKAVSDKDGTLFGEEPVEGTLGEVAYACAKEFVLASCRKFRETGDFSISTAMFKDSCQKKIPAYYDNNESVKDGTLSGYLPKWARNNVHIKKIKRGLYVLKEKDQKKIKRVLDSHPSDKQTTPADVSGSVTPHPHKKTTNDKKTVEKGSLNVSNDFQYTYLEGGNREIVVVIPKRSSKANAEKKKLGTTCCICGFDFEKAYGEIGKGFIHIHHIVQLADRKKEHVITLDDLRPVCPNCHAMLHRDPKNVLSI